MFWINDAKDGEKFQAANCSKWDELSANCSIVFDECKLREIDDGFEAFFYATKFTDVKKNKADNYKFEPGFVKLLFHGKEYDKRVKNDDEWKSVKTQPHSTELFWCQVFAELLKDYGENAFFRGIFTLAPPAVVQHMIMKGVDAKGVVLDQQIISFQKLQYVDVIPTEPDKLKDIDFSKQSSSSKKGGGSWGAKSQSEAERLTERWEFVKKHLSTLVGDCETVHDLAINAAKLTAEEYKILEISKTFFSVLIR